MIRNFSALWARGSDGAAPHVWVIRSAVFAVLLCAWSQWGGLLIDPLYGFAPTDFLLNESTTILLAGYLAYAARSVPRAITALAVLIASIIGTTAFGHLSGTWFQQVLERGGDDTTDGTALIFVRTAGTLLTVLLYWAAWGIARRRHPAWILSLPVPVVLSYAAPAALAAYLESLDLLQTPSMLPLFAAYAGSIIASILVAWAFDAIAWRRAGSPDWTERVGVEPRPPDPLVD
ncbi:hypothetical protein TPB0596_34100 [Tsukamurella pulmonis]|uniref:hypothetical protein n=1 Tax=Tsukamurella pulmonis TaxID=47312 RepID=UPI0007939018|nr:hypothetical protein [Tsukamurella pulmonis]KXP10900.1 hypothetical protein AXK57_05835 [Tsukamurella pulmonis]RDH13155.1 hypothetical protein DVB88_04015 [Tsukamurella pulmonis]BDD83647.1 hypothetical protein TPB0596_34100 [Tsukamurella pulmonis]